MECNTAKLIESITLALEQVVKLNVGVNNQATTIQTLTRSVAALQSRPPSCPPPLTKGRTRSRKQLHAPRAPHHHRPPPAAKKTYASAAQDTPANPTKPTKDSSR